MVIPSQKSETMNHLKTITMVSMETKFASQDSILDKLSENITLVDSEKGNRVFTRGGGHFVPPPPLPSGAQKKPALDRLRSCPDHAQRGRKSSFDHRCPSLFPKKKPARNVGRLWNLSGIFSKHWRIRWNLKKRIERHKYQIPSAKTFATFYLSFLPKNAQSSTVQHLTRDVNVGIHSVLCGETCHTKKNAKIGLIKIFSAKTFCIGENIQVAKTTTLERCMNLKLP